MNIQELKLKSSEQLITQAEELGIENASTLRKQDIFPNKRCMLITISPGQSLIETIIERKFLFH